MKEKRQKIISTSDRYLKPAFLCKDRPDVIKIIDSIVQIKSTNDEKDFLSSCVPYCKSRVQIKTETNENDFISL